MKKKLFGILVVVAALVATIAPAAAVHAAPPQTNVSGIITDGGVPVAGATVTVKCGAFTKTDTSDARGGYLVVFTDTECPPGSIVRVTATKGTKTGTRLGRVVGLTTKLNISLVNVDIPEYGWLGGLLAGGAGLGAIIFTRRRFAQGTTA